MSNTFKKWESLYPNSWFSCIPGKNGFMPVGDPLIKLPTQYEEINDILENMKINNNGYLANGKIGDYIDKLPKYDLHSIEDKQLLAALYRDFCFLASAYSLEPSHLNLKDGVYGKARDKLPPQLSEPLILLAQKVDSKPWLEYAYGYGLNNVCLKNPDMDPTDQKSYHTIRMFNGHDSESGFINVHAAMVSQSGELLLSQQEILDGISSNNRVKVNKSLRNHYLTLSKIITILQSMWKSSNPKEYLTFRTFIMGQYNNIVYENQNIKFMRENGEDEIHSYRGETGAQDSLVPSVDSLLELSYPRNSLTEYLYQLREYRPKDHQEYINYLKVNSKNLRLREYCLGEVGSSILLLKNLNCLRMFRKKHWNLTKKYIIQNTKHPTATGGTPITTWLPNQLGATLEYMDDVVKNIDKLLLSGSKISDIDSEYFNSIKVELSDHIQTVNDEVSILQDKFYNQEHSDFLNREKK